MSVQSQVLELKDFAYLKDFLGPWKYCLCVDLFQYIHSKKTDNAGYLNLPLFTFSGGNKKEVFGTTEEFAVVDDVLEELLKDIF